VRIRPDDLRGPAPGASAGVGRTSEDAAHEARDGRDEPAEQLRTQREEDRGDEEPEQDEQQDARGAAPGAVGTAARGELARAQGWTPSRRAERARWRLVRMRRSRFTSIGSWRSASGVSMRALSSW
jgi:hypothetical protein